MKKYCVIEVATEKRVSSLYGNRRQALLHADQLNCENNGGYRAATEDIIEEPEDVETLNDLADGMNWAADRAMTHAPAGRSY